MGSKRSELSETRTGSESAGLQLNPLRVSNEFMNFNSVDGVESH